MSGDIPQWAIRRALEVADYSCPVQEVVDRRTLFWSQIERFAAYIAAHEDPPVDPLLIEAREIAGDAMAAFTWEGQGFATGAINAVRTGNDDSALQVVTALTALRRGMELSKQEPTP